MIDLKFALRALARSPVFTLISVATLALGIGLNTAMFSLMNAIFLRPLPFEDSASLVRLYRSTPGNPDGDFPMSDYRELRAEEGGFGHFAGSYEESVSVSDTGKPAGTESAMRVSADYFDVLKVRPRIGRAFRPDEELQGKARVAIISEEVWRERFAATPDILSRSIRIDGEPHDIVGVLPETADDGRVIRHVGVFRPALLGGSAPRSQAAPWMKVIGRRAGGTAEAEGGALVAALGERVSRESAKDDAGATWRSEPLLGSTNNQAGRIIAAMLLCLSGFVLLIACSNLANFVLARTIERSQELSVRSSLGASRFQLVRPLVLESLLLAACGGLGALLVAGWSARWLSAQSIASGGSPMDFPLDWRVLGFAIGSSLATALFFGTAPAFLILRVNAERTMKSGMRAATAGAGQQRLRRLLVVGQFAMAMTLLAGAGFLMRGADSMIRHHFGWESANVVTGAVDLPKARYDTPGKILGLQRQLSDRLRSIPGVESVALAYALPYNGEIGTRPYIVEGREPPARGQELTASYDGITPEYFSVTGIRLLDGRTFRDADTTASARVVIISQAMARALFPNDSPLGKRIARADAQGPEWSQVVGVAGDVQPAGIYQRPTSFQVYQPLAQEPWLRTNFGIRTAPGASNAVMGAVTAAVAAVDLDLPVDKLMTADQRVESSTFDLGMLEKMLGAFALLGLSLAALGIYGVVARTVVQRTREIGIRMALGATLSDVSRMILGSGLRLALVGASLGIAGGFGLNRLLSGMLPGLDSSSGTVIAEAATVLGVVALLASYLPARRASRVDPVAALRSE